MDVCNATTRERGRLDICGLPVGHEEDHDDLRGFTWRQEPVIDSGEVIFPG